MGPTYLIMGMKPPNPDIIAVHTYWNSSEGFKCPLCNSQLNYAYNDGGRLVITLKGNLWVVSNYYRCLNNDCEFNRAFPVVHENVIQNKKFGRDVWERIIRFHFRYHMDYSQIKMMLLDEWAVSISKGTIGNICRHFEGASQVYLNEQVLKDIQASGKIMLSLDGAQPKKGRPALWIFSDRITGHVLLSVLLDSAPSPILVEKMSEIQEKYGVPIEAVISDKQKNIVNAVKQFNSEIPHAFCQYHFLSHIMGPVQSKDSHLATQLKKKVRSLSVIAKQPLGQLNKRNPEYNPLYDILSPLAEELLGAIAVSGKKWKVFKGKEIYENLDYIVKKLNKLSLIDISQKIKHSLQSVASSLGQLLKKHQNLYDEILVLLDDSKDLRKVLDNSRNTAKYIQKKTFTWIYRLQSRLKSRGLEYRGKDIGYVQMNHDSDLTTIWQQWVRLEHSYSEGIYLSYKNEEIEKTNNAKEQLINRTKRHFKKWLGQQDFQKVFEKHGAIYSTLVPLDLNSEKIHEILWKHSVAYVEGYISGFSTFQPITNRRWQIREINTGNWDVLQKNIKS